MVEELPNQRADATSDLSKRVDKVIATRSRQLCQMTIDVVYAHDRALKSIDPSHQEISDALMAFRDSCIEHVHELSSTIFGFGGLPPEMSRDLKGFFIDGMTRIQALIGTAGALSALRLTVRLASRVYERALIWEMPDGLRQLIEDQIQAFASECDFIDRTLPDLARVKSNGNPNS